MTFLECFSLRTSVWYRAAIRIAARSVASACRVVDDARPCPPLLSRGIRSFHLFPVLRRSDYLEPKMNDDLFSV